MALGVGNTPASGDMYPPGVDTLLKASKLEFCPGVTYGQFAGDPLNGVAVEAAAKQRGKSSALSIYCKVVQSLTVLRNLAGMDLQFGASQSLAIVPVVLANSTLKVPTSKKRC